MRLSLQRQLVCVRCAIFCTQSQICCQRICVVYSTIIVVVTFTAVTVAVVPSARLVVPLPVRVRCWWRTWFAGKETSDCRQAAPWAAAAATSHSQLFWPHQLFPNATSWTQSRHQPCLWRQAKGYVSNHILITDVDGVFSDIKVDAITSGFFCRMIYTLRLTLKVQVD